MPVSHIGLTVSHLPTSTSFFLSALQPLGYRFIGQQGSQIGLGIEDADFFLCQEGPGIPATAAHIAFTAPSRTAVRDFYAAALNAGARPNGAPACRTEDSDHFNAAVLDFDGNSIEVVYRGGEPDVRDDGTVVQHSRVIEWRRSVSGSVRDGDGASVVSARTSASRNAPSIASAAETLSRAATLVRSVSAPVAPTIATTPGATAPQVSAEVTTTTTTKVTASGDGAAKKIIGTLLGAAAGAAVAYAMVKSEEDSAKKEAKFIRYMEAKEAAALQQQQQLQHQQQAPLAIQEAQPVYSSAPRSVVSGTSAYGPRAIEAAPQGYHSPSYVTVPPTQVNAAGGERLAIEYAPAYSVAGSQTQSQFAPPRRSVTSPELSTVSVSKARSTVSRAPSAVQSVAASTLISSFVPEHVERRGSEGSVYSSSSRAHKAKSQVSTYSKHSSKSKPASIVGSILGRPSPSTTSSHKDPFADAYEIVDIDDLDDVDVDDASVAPSDSVSNVSSHRSRRSHRSSHSHHSSKSHKSRKERDGEGTVVSSASKHSSSSKHSKHSKHTSASKRSEKSHRSSPLREEWHDAESGAGKRSVVSEPSDASTVKPAKSTHSSHSRSSKRKDSVTSGNGYETLPIRGITPSMIAGDDGNAAGTSKSMMSYAMGQRLRAFEGAS